MKHAHTKTVLMLLVASIVAGCGGGGGGGGANEQAATPPLSANAAPTVSAFVNQTTDEGATLGPLAFTIGDAETDASALTVSVASSDPALLPAAGFELAGTGADRSLTITPAAEGAGSADITVTVTDASGAKGNSTFKLGVNALFRAQFSSWFRQTVLPQQEDAKPIGAAGEEGQALPQVEDINRIRMQDDTAENPQAYDDLLPPPEPTEGSV